MSNTVKKMYTLLDLISGNFIKPKYKTPAMIQRDVANAEFRRDAEREEKMVSEYDDEIFPDTEEGDK